jgi:hypothetical protein
VSSKQLLCLDKADQIPFSGQQQKHSSSSFQATSPFETRKSNPLRASTSLLSVSEAIIPDHVVLVEIFLQLHTLMYVVKEKDQLKHIPLVNVCIPQLIRFDELIQCLRSSGPCPETQYDGYFSCPLFRDSARGEYFLLFCLLSSIEGKTRSGPTAHPLDFSHIHPTTRPSTTDGTPHPIAYTNQPTASSHHHIITATMANIGSEAATVVDAKISTFRTLQEELQTHHSDLGTLMAQRNENEMVLQELEVCEGEDDAVVYKQVGSCV